MNDILTYNIIFDIPKDSSVEVDNFVAGMQDCLLALQEFNKAIALGVDSDIEVISHIQELAGGSIKYKLKDVINVVKQQEIEQVGVALYGAGTGDYTAAVGLLLKTAKEVFIEFNYQNLSDKEKEDKLIEDITKIVENSKINNELKGYVLDRKPILKSIRKFYQGVKKTQGNVYYQKTDNSERIRIEHNFDDENTIELINENMLQRTENATIRIIKPDLDGKSKWECYWNKRIKANVQDNGFIKKIAEGFKIGNKMRFVVTLQIIEKLDVNGNSIEGKEEYNIIKINKIIEDPIQTSFSV